MPHKKRSHGHQKKTEYGGSNPTLIGDYQSSRTSNYFTSTSPHAKSQKSPTTPSPAAQVSTTKPAQLEKASSGSDMASKPTTATGTAATATGSAALAGGAETAMPRRTLTPAVTPEIAAAAQVNVPASTPTGPTSTPKPAVAAPKPKESPKDTAKSATATFKDVPKVSAPAAAATVGTGKKTTGDTKLTQTKVQADVAAEKAAKEASAEDPFDALASGLPSLEPQTSPVYTGPEVTEAPAPVDVKPKDVPTPMSSDEALDSLTEGFMTDPPASKTQTKPVACTQPPAVAVCPAPPADKKARMETVQQPSPPAMIACSLFGPPSTKAQETKPTTDKKPAAAEKKGKVEPVKTGKDASVVTKPKTDEKPVKAVKDSPVATKPKTDNKGGSMSLDALEALGDTLSGPEPDPEPPKLRPEDIVSEVELKGEKGVLVGEREDTLPPAYRFSKDKHQVLPTPEPEPAMDTGDALDILTGDFSSPLPAVCPPAPAAQVQVEDLSALDFLDGDFVAPNKASAVQAPFPPATKKTPEIAVCAMVPPSSVPDIKPTTDKKSAPAEKKNKVEPVKAGKDVASKPKTDEKPVKAVKDAAVATQPKANEKPAPAEKKNKVEPVKTGKDAPVVTKPKTDEGGSMSLDALEALGDTLGAPEPVPEPPKLNPKDIVSEGTLHSEKGVFVGERDDTLPPEYRFTGDEHKHLPAPEPEAKMDAGEALDILTGDFSVPAVPAPAVCPSGPPAQPPQDFALDALAGDFVAPAVAPAVKSACPPTEPSRQMSIGTSNAMDALSDTLVMDITPVPEPAPIPAKDLVKEKKAVEERLTKLGDRDDTLPPEFRPTEKDIKAAAEAKAKDKDKPKEKPLDDKAALDLMSADFVATATPTPTVADTTKLTAPVLETEPLKPMAGTVLDSLSGTLLADKPKDDKAKKSHAEDPSPVDQLSGQRSSDVVPTSTKKGGES